MAHIYDITRNRPVPENNTADYLADHGIHYETWPLDVVPEVIRRRDTLPDDDHKTILSAYDSHLARLARDFGYTSHDVIVLNASVTANLEDLLINFRREHHHTEDEVRFIVDGEGIFTLIRHGDTFAVTVQAGDMLSVPAGTRHFFTLTELRRVKAIRLFQNPDGWVAIYDREEVAP